ncbi:MAG TPA: hypothetical protein VNR41_11090 [Xanthobacteraceae bacterium]|jgi:hypothetical protein|nr:hypothetical protein [Xanthobacteraceae bacterium]
MSHTLYPGRPAEPFKRQADEKQIGEHSAKLQNDLTPELRDKERREWKGGDLMSEEQARRLREVSLKKAKKKTRQPGQPMPRMGQPGRNP